LQSEIIIKSAGKNLWVAERNLEKNLPSQDLRKNPNDSIPSNSFLDLIGRPLISENKTESSVATQPLISETSLTGNPFLINNKTETNKGSTTTSTNGLFSDFLAKTAGPTSGLFSSSTSSTKSLFSSAPNDASFNLFGNASNGQNSLFQSTKTKVSKTFEKESGNEIVSFTTKGQVNSSLSSCNLFSNAKTSPNLFIDKAYLFLNKSEPDIIFKAENKEFPAHKKIISEKYPFFKNMFASGMMESHLSVIEIEDTKAETFLAFLTWIYFGKIDLHQDLALNLVKFADKYLLNDLTKFCEQYLMKILTVDNCAKIFEVVYFSGAEVLKVQTEAFIRGNLKEIMKRKDFEDFPKISYLHILEIYWNTKPVFGPPFSKLIVNKY